jgi:hypothetical protein
MKASTISENQTDRKKIQERVTRELQSILGSLSGGVVLTEKVAIELHPATRLVLFLKAISRQWWIKDPAVYRALHREWAQCVNSYIGGITRGTFTEYGWILEVHEAAEFHRATFQPRPPKI